MEFQIAASTYTRGPVRRVRDCIGTGERRTNRCCDSSPISHPVCTGGESGLLGHGVTLRASTMKPKNFRSRSRSSRTITVRHIVHRRLVIPVSSYETRPPTDRSRGWLKQLRSTNETVSLIHLYVPWSVSRICHRMFVHTLEFRSGSKNHPLRAT